MLHRLQCHSNALCIGKAANKYCYCCRSLRSKHFQSSYCAKDKARAKKKMEGRRGGEKRKRLSANPASSPVARDHWGIFELIIKESGNEGNDLFLSITPRSRSTLVPIIPLFRFSRACEFPNPHLALGKTVEEAAQTPRFWKFHNLVPSLDISRFGSFVNWQLVKTEDSITTGSPRSKYEQNIRIVAYGLLLRNIRNIWICMGKTYCFYNLRKYNDFNKKNSLPYLKCVLPLSCVVHGPIYGRFMGFYVNGFLSNLYTERKPADLLNIFYRFVHSRVLGWIVCSYFH